MRIRAILLVGACVGFFSLSISALIFAGVTDNPVPYETPVFKAEFPAGSKVETREKKTNAHVRHTFEATVSTKGDTALAILEYVEYTDLSIERSISLDDMAKMTNSQLAGDLFVPGTVLARPVTDKTIGGLPAKETVDYGTQVYYKKPGVVCVRVAVKGNRVWILMTSATIGALSEQASMKFFDSVKIKQ